MPIRVIKSAQSEGISAENLIVIDYGGFLFKRLKVGE